MKTQTNNWNAPKAAQLTGALMIGGAFIAVAWPHVGSFSIVGLVWGSLLFWSGLFFNHRTTVQRREHELNLARLEERHRETELKRDVLKDVLTKGLADGVLREWVEHMLNWRADEKDETKLRRANR